MADIKLKDWGGNPQIYTGVSKIAVPNNSGGFEEYIKDNSRVKAFDIVIPSTKSLNNLYTFVSGDKDIAAHYADEGLSISILLTTHMTILTSSHILLKIDSKNKKYFPDYNYFGNAVYSNGGTGTLTDVTTKLNGMETPGSYSAALHVNSSGDVTLQCNKTGYDIVYVYQNMIYRVVVSW